MKLSSRSFPARPRRPLAHPLEKEEDDRESVPSPYAEDIQPWLHVPPLKRRDEGRSTEAKRKEIKQHGERHEMREREKERRRMRREKSERGKMVTRPSICNQCLLCLAGR